MYECNWYFKINKKEEFLPPKKHLKKKKKFIINYIKIENIACNILLTPFMQLIPVRNVFTF